MRAPFAAVIEIRKCLEEIGASDGAALSVRFFITKMFESDDFDGRYGARVTVSDDAALRAVYGCCFSFAFPRVGQFLRVVEHELCALKERIQTWVLHRRAREYVPVKEVEVC